MTMAGLDHNIAGVSQRELYSLNREAVEQALGRLTSRPEVRGAVILSTCNRMEIYLSCEDNCSPDPFLLLGYHTPHAFRKSQEVLPHLCRVAAGVCSQIWGEEQIITQVKDAILTARECQAADSVLEVAFRTAISAGKKIRTQVVMKTPSGGLAERVLCSIREHSPDNEKVLVIGNGEIGRLVTGELIQNGYETTVTLRHYKHGNNVVPPGALTVDYQDRYDAAEKCDVVVSATRSPHLTVYLEGLLELSAYPKLFIDLAMPRDIDPEIAKLPGVVCRNIDDMAKRDIEEDRMEQIPKIEEIITKSVSDFQKWELYRKKHRGVG